MKNLFAFLLISLFPPTTSAMETVFFFDLFDGYVVSSGQKIIDRPVQQINLYTEFENGMYINLWSAVDDYDRIEEVDYTAGYIWQMSDRMLIDVSVTWWDISELGSSEYDAFVPAIRLEYFLSESVAGYFNLEPVFADNSDYNGIESYIGLSKYFPIHDTFLISGTINIGYDSTYGLNQKYIQFSIVPSYNVNNKVSLRFLGVSAWFPENTPDEIEINFIGIDYVF